MYFSSVEDQPWTPTPESLFTVYAHVYRTDALSRKYAGYRLVPGNPECEENTSKHGVGLAREELAAASGKETRPKRKRCAPQPCDGNRVRAGSLISK
jgi:hypothetical protein